MTIEQKLLQIKNDLSNHHNCKDEIMKTCITQRLKESQETYIMEMTSTFNYLKSTNPVKLLKMLMKGK